MKLNTCSLRRELNAAAHLLLAGMLRQLLRLDDHFNPLQMRCEGLARPRRTVAIRTLAALVDLCPDRGDAGFNFLEDKGLLLVVGGWGAELFRSAAKRIEGFQDLRQPLDALVGIGVARLEIGDLVLQRVGPRRLLDHGKHHGFQRFYVIREFEIGRRHRVDQSTFCSGFPALFRVLVHFAAGLLPNNLRRLHRHGPNPLPVHAIDQRQKLGMVELNAVMTDPRPAELRFFQPLLTHKRMQPLPACFTNFVTAIPVIRGQRFQ